MYVKSAHNFYFSRYNNNNDSETWLLNGHKNNIGTEYITMKKDD